MNKVLSLICIASALFAQGVAAQSAGPLSFYKIGANQRIHFDVSSGGTQPTIMFFQVDVYPASERRADIVLQISAATQFDKAEKVWGHHVSEKVTKTLSEKDIKYLESYLVACRDRGVPHDLTGTSPGWREFQLHQLFGGQWGLVQRELYSDKPSKEADSEFIKTFIGLSPAH